MHVRPDVRRGQGARWDWVADRVHLACPQFFRRNRCSCPFHNACRRAMLYAMQPRCRTFSYVVKEPMGREREREREREGENRGPAEREDERGKEGEVDGGEEKDKERNQRRGRRRPMAAPRLFRYDRNLRTRPAAGIRTARFLAVAAGPIALDMSALIRRSRGRAMKDDVFLAPRKSRQVEKYSVLPGERRGGGGRGRGGQSSESDSPGRFPGGNAGNAGKCGRQ